MTPARYLMKCQTCLRFFGGRSLSSSSSVNPRFNGLFRVEVEEALMDYFHCTRSLNYLDARHISKNSPHFVKFLFKNLETRIPSNQHGNVCSEVKKFLRYNPINEFNPFLESSGLSPLEIQRLLSTSSRALCFFLSDDAGLLENYHVLCNYGIPRFKIGKIYKEAHEVFKMEQGVLKSKLEGFENEIGLEVSTVIKLVSSCPNILLLSSTENEQFVQTVVALKEFGFQQKWIRSNLSTKYKYRWDMMLPLLEFFLHQMDCQEDDLRTMIKKNPWFLFDQPGKIPYMAMPIFLKIGLNRYEILELLLNFPQIVSRQSILKILLKWVEFLNPEETATLLASQPCSSLVYLLSKKPEYLLATIDNIDAQKLRSMMLHDPTELSELLLSEKNTQKSMVVLPLLYRKESINKMDFLVKIGFSENFNEMEAAQAQFQGSGSRLEARFNVLLEAGLGFEVCSKIVKECPKILNQTTKNLRTKIDYMVNIGGYPLDTVINFPMYFCYDIESIRNRLKMFRWIKENGAVKPHHAAASFHSIIAGSTKSFLKNYVNDIPNGLQVWKKLQESSFIF